MSRVSKTYPEVFVDFDDFVARYDLKERKARLGIRHCIEGQNRLISPPAVLLGLPGRFHFLYMSRVEQQYPSELGCGQGGVNFAPKSVSDQPGYTSAVVDMGMSEEESGDVSRLEPPRLAIEVFHVLTTLEEPTVHKVLPAIVQEKTGAGHASGRSQTGDIHDRPFCDSPPLNIAVSPGYSFC